MAGSMTEASAIARAHERAGTGVAERDQLGVVPAAEGLDERGDASVEQHLRRVPGHEREERVRGGDRAGCPLAGLRDRELGRAQPVRLAGARPD